MEKLVCKECGGTLWTKGQSYIYTTYPAIHVQEYKCEKCGYIHKIERREMPVSNPPREVLVPDQNNETSLPITTSSTPNSITFTYSSDGINQKYTGGVSDTAFSFPKKKE